MLVKKEGLNRLLAERRLMALYRREYQRLAHRHGHVEALRSLVKSHKDRYDAIVRQFRGI
jgi:hypothetical protein